LTRTVNLVKHPTVVHLAGHTHTHTHLKLCLSPSLRKTKVWLDTSIAVSD